MKYNPKLHHRRSIRLKEYNYSQSGAYFITICVKNRECLFGEILNGKMKLNEYGKIIQQYWFDIPNQYPNVILDEYIVMPNHIHGIVIINVLLPKIIGYFKMDVAKQINQLRQTPGTPVWQRSSDE